MRIALFLSAALLCGGCEDRPFVQEAVQVDPVSVPALVEAPLPETDSAPAEPSNVDGPVSEPVDFYAGHTQWCEWVRPNKCGRAREKNYSTKRMEWVDYGACGTDHRGVKLRCVRPYWAKSDEAKLCVSPFPPPAEQAWRRQRLRFIVGRFFGLEGEWWKRVSTDHDAVRAQRLYRFFRVIAGRESSYRPWKAHNLGPDVEGAGAAYYRAEKQGTYSDNEHFAGYRLLAGPGTREGEMDFEFVENYKTYQEARDREAEILARNARWVTFVQKNEERWKSFGYAGQTTAGFVAEVDPTAPPEVLCLEAFSFGAYMNRVQTFWAKLPRDYDCKDAHGHAYEREKLQLGEQAKDGVRETRRDRTWHVLHRGASGGSGCPRDSADWLQTHKGFARRARSKGLNPDQKVTRKMLGPKPTRELLMRITEEVNAEFCGTFEAWQRKQETGRCD